MTEVVKNKYETVIVLSAKLGEEGNAELVEKFKALIAKHGTVESVDEWGKRRLAYPINKGNRRLLHPRKLREHAGLHR